MALLSPPQPHCLSPRLAYGEAMSDPATAPEVSALSFEEALAELETIVSELESGQAPLERAIALYQRGAELKAHCEGRLEQARLRVEKIVMGPEGQAQSVQAADFS